MYCEHCGYELVGVSVVNNRLEMRIDYLCPNGCGGIVGETGSPLLEGYNLKEIDDLVKKKGVSQ